MADRFTPTASDPVAEFVRKLHLPKWTSAEFSLGLTWGFEVPPGLGCMAVILRGGGWYQRTETNRAPVCLSAGDHLLATQGVGHRFVRHPGQVCQGVTELMAEHPVGGSPLCRGGTLILYAQFESNANPRDALGLSLPEEVRLSHRRDVRLASCQPILELMVADAGASPAYPSVPMKQLMTNKLAELIFLQTLFVALESRFAPQNAPATSRLFEAITDRAIGPVLNDLADQPDYPWTVRLMARTAGISKSTLCERFRNLVGRSPLQHLTELRMQKACRLLHENDLDLSRIAVQVGYESASSFSNVFKKWAGFSPAEYRRRSLEIRQPSSVDG